MGGHSFAQILLYLFAAIVAIVAIYKPGGKKWNSLYTAISITLIFLILIFSLLLEMFRYDDEKNASEKKEREHKQYIDSLSSILKKSDSTLNTQAILQKRTDSLLIKSNEISKESQNVLLNTISVLDNQEKTFVDEERKRDPLFPMDLEITLKLSFDHEILKDVLDTFLYYKKVSESNIPYDKNRIEVNWSGDKEKISNIIFKDFERYFKYDVNTYNRIEFILNKEFYVSVYPEFNGNPEQLLLKSTPVFRAITNKKFGAVHDISQLEVDYDNRIVYIITRFKKIIFINPLPKRPIGVADLINHYLVIFPSGLCNCELFKVRMEVGKTAYKSLVNLVMDKSNFYPWGKSGNCKVFIRKVGQNEIMRPVQPSD